jgi:hypothetical protein
MNWREIEGIFDLAFSIVNFVRRRAKISVAQKESIADMCEFDAVLAEHPEAKFGDDGAPVEHGFGDGLYIRKITMPAGLLVSSEIHETTHPYFVLAGQALVKTEVGWRIIRAPYHGMTRAGTKRILYIIEVDYGPCLENERHPEDSKKDTGPTGQVYECRIKRGIEEGPEMSWIFIAISVGTAVYSTQEQKKSAKAQADQGEAAAKFNAAQNLRKAAIIRKIGAEDEFEMRAELRRRLARNRVATAAAGVLPSTGTPLDTELLVIRDAAADIATLEENTRLAAQEPELVSDLQLMQAKDIQRAGDVNQRAAQVQGATAITAAISTGFNK